MATLPVNRGRLSGASIASFASESSEVQTTCDEMQHVLAKAWAVPRRTVILPPLRTLNMAALLSFHAAHLQQEAGMGEQPARKRARRKQKLPLDRLLHAIAEQPDRRAAMPCDGWEDRRAAFNYTAAVVSLHYSIGSQRQARELLKPVWSELGQGVKDNFWALRVFFGMPLVQDRAAREEVDELVEGAGAMLTWQTSFGRAGDVIGKLFAVQASIADMQEVAQHDASLIEFFGDFVQWLEEQAKIHGMECWAASLELNSPDAEEARVHLHAYVCRHWKFWHTSSWSRSGFCKADWSWGGMKPHLVVANMKPNASPMRALTVGLYYVLAPKIGSIFRRSNLVLWKDLFVAPSCIHDMWRQRKLSHADAKAELLASRGRGASKAIIEIDYHAEAELKTQVDQTMRQREAVIQCSLGIFRDHPVIDQFMLQFNPANMAGATRFLCLLLRGPSQCGKSQRAEALHGPEATLTVNCQGISPSLPSIKSFNRAKHLAILWDEVDEAQVLNNKMIFQAGNKLQALGQSACNAFSYERYLFGTAMLLCSNTFSFTHSRGKPLGQLDKDRLEKNVMVAELPDGCKWFLSLPEAEEQPAAHLGESASSASAGGVA